MHARSALVLTGTAVPARAHRTGRTLPLVTTTVLVAVGAVLATWPLARHIGSAALRSGEVLLTAWQINWFHHAILTDPLVWADANIFFPYDGAATFNDLLLAHALVTLPAAWTDSPVLALNLAFLGGIVLCGVFAHLLIDELADAPWAAVAGGVLFALAPFRFLHLGHLSIAAAWAIPLFFWALLRHLRQPSWTWAALVSLSGLLVALSSLYHAAYVAPILPLVLAVGVRRGPGGRATWIPLLAAGVPGLALLAWFLLPFAATLRSFGVASAPDDLVRYGADLSSLARKPDFLGGSGAEGIDPEAHLYPGTALALLSAAGAIGAIASARALRGWMRPAAATLLALAAAAALALLVPLPAGLAGTRNAGLLALIWLGPIIVTLWALVTTTRTASVGPAVALRLGLAGAALSFALALGPEARYQGAAVGPGPYALLAALSSTFEGTRVPARFGGLVLLFLSLVAGGTIAAIARSGGRRSRAAAVVVAGVALAACFGELPIPALPKGRELVSVPPLRDPAYQWLREQPGRFGILEVPDWPPESDVHWRHRDWRALRYMLASKQHAQHLVNGTGRIEPFFYNRFRGIEPWSENFFAFIVSYLPVKYVLVHEGGLPLESRDAVWKRLESGRDGWRSVFTSSAIRVYTVDRSAGRGAPVDRVYLRRDLAPAATLRFSARVGSGAAMPTAAASRGTLELLRDGEQVGSWGVGPDWRPVSLRVPLPEAAPDAYDRRCARGVAPCSGWPASTVLFRWRVREGGEAQIEIEGLAVERAQ